MAKTPNPQVLARVSLCWPPMSVCGKNVYALRACKRSNRDFLCLYTNTVFLYYAESTKVPPRVFSPLGPKTLRGQKAASRGKTFYLIIRFLATLRWPQPSSSLSRVFQFRHFVGCFLATLLCFPPSFPVLLIAQFWKTGQT